ncbi:hypothetical protein FO519_002628 [Halicephalobus sp. NKZ332]|nr:hypothetical protein FO519_002628 [Halicephalobus sp. NKZ332]
MDGSGVVDKENQGFPFLQSLPVIRKNALKRSVPFGSDDTNIKKRKKDLPTYFEYIHHSKWIADNYVDLQLIGKGAFGIVYRARCRSDESKIVAIKEILKKKVSDPMNAAVCEITLVKELGGKRNILPTIATHESRGSMDMGNFVVMEYFPHDPFQDVIKIINSEEIIHYGVNLISALEYLHANLIIHRDVKPDNFLYNRAQRRYALIDFGLSQRYNKNIDRAEELKKKFKDGASVSPGQKRNRIQMPCSCDSVMTEPCTSCKMKEKFVVNKAGTPRFLAPEVLIGSAKQTTKMDIWAVGMILFYMVVRNYRFFAARDELAMILELSAVFGTESFEQIGRDVGIELTTTVKFRRLNLKHFCLAHRYGLKGFGVKKNCEYCRYYFRRPLTRCFCSPRDSSKEFRKYVGKNDEKIGKLLDYCLQVDPSKRPGSTELLEMFGNEKSL